MSYKDETNLISIIRDMIPQELTRLKLVELAYNLCYGVNYLYFVIFKEYYQAVELDLAITPQVCVLEKYLNDRFDSVNRLIYIEDGFQYPATFIFLRAEEKPKAIYIRAENKPVYLGLRSESGYKSVSFRVRVPIEALPQKEVITAWVNKYKLATKTFTVLEI